MNVGWMKLPSHFSPKISSKSLALPMLSSVSMCCALQNAINSLSPIPLTSVPVKCSMAPKNDMRLNGRWKLMVFSPTGSAVFP